MSTVAERVVRRECALVVGGAAPARAVLLGALAARGFVADEARSAEEALDTLGDRDWQVVIADQDLPGMSGMSLLAKLREAAPDCEVILVSARATVDAAMEASTLGASEFLAHPIEPAALAEIASRVTAQARDERRQRRVRYGRRPSGGAAGDPLADLLNPQEIEEVAVGELHRAERYGHAVSVVVVSLDQLGSYRKVLGDAAADAAVRRIAGLVYGNTRSMDAVGRHGIDGFVLVLPHTGEDAARFVARKLRLLVVESTLPGRERLPGEKFELSAGVASFPQDGHTWPDLLAYARAEVRRTRARGGGVAAKLS